MAALPAVRRDISPVVNWVERVSLFCVSFSAWTLSVYSVAGRRPFRSYSTVFPDTIWVTSGSKKKTQKRECHYSDMSGCTQLHAPLRVLGFFTSWDQVQKNKNPEPICLLTPMGSLNYTRVFYLKVLALSSVHMNYNTIFSFQEYQLSLFLSELGMPN